MIRLMGLWYSLLKAISTKSPKSLPSYENSNYASLMNYFRLVARAKDLIQLVMQGHLKALCKT